MQNILAIDVAKGKSMVTLISSSGEVLINPYEINHSINDFSNLLNRINNLKLENISVIIESTGIYHKPIERFFLENNFKVYTINALSFISNYPHANIISNTRIDCLQNYFKNNNFRYWRRKATLIKEIAKLSYPSVSKNDELVNDLSQMATLIKTYQSEINKIKFKLIEYGKQTKYFNKINSIFGIGEFTTSIIIAELGDINRFNNIKEITAYCGLDPSIKQSGKSIDIHGPISKSGNKYIRKLLFISCLNIVRLSSKCHIENDIEIYYRKKRNEGKHHYAAIIACTLNFYVKY